MTARRPKYMVRIAAICYFCGAEAVKPLADDRLYCAECHGNAMMRALTDEIAVLRKQVFGEQSAGEIAKLKSKVDDRQRVIRALQRERDEFARDADQAQKTLRECAQVAEKAMDTFFGRGSLSSRTGALHDALRAIIKAARGGEE